MVLFFSVAFTFINIVLWIVMLVKFRKLFSTDDIITRTRKEMNSLVRDINNNASRNIDLLENRIEKLRALIGEADKKISLIEGELAKQNTAAALQHQIKPSHKKASIGKTPAQRAVEKYKVAAGTKFSHESYELTAEGEAYRNDFSEQGSLFVQSTQADSMAQNKLPETQVTVSEDGAATAQVPVILPKIYFAEDQITASKKSFDETVLELYDNGYSVEEISKKLSCSTTEVLFVIDLNR